MDHVHVGTCGFSYPEWVEAGIYPPKTKSAAMLELYAALFPVVELNYTWYQMVKAEALERMLSRVPPSFLFSAKLTRTLTHEKSEDWQKQAKLFCTGIAPLLASAQLSGVLVQFPPSFTRTQNNRYYLANLLDALAELPLVVEFRHRSWAHDRVFQELEARRITLATVDAPELPGLFPCLAVATNPDLFYFRLHGRNAGGWYSGTMQQQFNYSYSDAELSRLKDEIILPLHQQATSGVIVFNNHVAGQAVNNARSLSRLLF